MMTMRTIPEGGRCNNGREMEECDGAHYISSDQFEGGSGERGERWEIQIGGDDDNMDSFKGGRCNNGREMEECDGMHHISSDQFEGGRAEKRERAANHLMSKYLHCIVLDQINFFFISLLGNAFPEFHLGPVQGIQLLLM